MTDDQLKAIDDIVSKGQPTFCESAHPDAELSSKELIAAGFISYAKLSYFNFEIPAERTLWVRRADNRCVPELHALATLRCGTLQSMQYPVWVDGNPLNRALSNVWIAARTFKSGTKEYYRTYYEKPENRAKQRDRAKRSAAKRRQAVQQAKQAVDAATQQRIHEAIMPPDGRVGDPDDRPSTQSPELVQSINVFDVDGDEIDEITQGND